MHSLRTPSWHGGLCAPLIAHLLFGVEDHPLADIDPNPLWKKQIVVRCGNKKGVKGQRASDFCHDVAHAHYTHTLTVAHLRLKKCEIEQVEEMTATEDSVEIEAKKVEVRVDLTLEDGADEDNPIDLRLTKMARF